MLSVRSDVVRGRSSVQSLVVSNVYYVIREACRTLPCAGDRTYAANESTLVSVASDRPCRQRRRVAARSLRKLAKCLSTSFSSLSPASSNGEGLLNCKGLSKGEGLCKGEGL